MNSAYHQPHDMSHHTGVSSSASYPTPPSNVLPPPAAMHPYAHQSHHQQQPPPPPLPPPQHHQPPPRPPPAQHHSSTTSLSHHSIQSQSTRQHPSSLSSGPLPGRSHVEDPAASHGSADKLIRTQPRLTPISQVENGSGRKYHLDVVQQPKRARMCGYGDKDRRPITPPPCVRLIITNFETGEELSCKDMDYSMFVLNVDLWDENGAQEVNLCRQPSSTGAPSISATTSFPYTAVNGNDPSPVAYSSQVLPPSREPAYGQPSSHSYASDYQSQHGYNQRESHYSPSIKIDAQLRCQASPSYPQNGSYGPPRQYFPHHQSYGSEQTSGTLASQRFDGSGSTMSYVETNGPSVYVHDQYKGALNRNLIGSVAASAFCLTDTSDREGVWFVLQDLSVRLEGTYRLRFSFVNVGTPSRDRGPVTITKGQAPILASCFSEKFNVYSAKKFPGVCESTPLSKTFATQGIKIPIRKDGSKGENDEDGE